jgi:hypothetical protein
MSPELQPGSYLDPGDPLVPAEIPDGWVAWVEDGVVRMEEDAGDSPGSGPIEDM